jgi:hypothetical protein
MNRAILLVAAFGVGVSLAAENNFKASQSNISKEIQDFLEEEESYDSQVVPAKTYTVDILGRKKSSNNVTLLGKARTSKKRKIRVDITNLEMPDYKVKTTSRRMEVDKETGKVRLWLNDKEVSPEELEKANEKAIRERPPFVAGYTDSLSAEEIRSLLEKNKNIYIDKYAEPISQMAYTSILNKSQITTHAFTNSAKGNGVGIHFQESGCPHYAFRTSNYFQINNCAHGVQFHPTGVLQVLSNTAPEATIYGQDEGAMNGDAQPWPNPWQHPTGSNNPDIFISSHSWAASDSPADEYVDVDMKMDNYVYNTRIVAVVAAGNSSNAGDNFYVRSPGKALNAITVGAVDPANDNYVYYSNWKNSEIGNEKPEVANYTNFDFGDSYIYNGFFNGTSAATPYTAAMIADLMSHSQYHSAMLKGHPELVKAVLVSGEKRPIPNAATFDPQNTTVAAKGIPVYSSLAWNRSAFRTWEGENNEVFNSNQKITFTEAGIKGAHYRIGIAWLTSGKYIFYNKGLTASNKKLPQDIDLKVYQNGNVIAQSASYNNPFEVVDFTPENNGDLTIEIHRWRNTQNQSNEYMPPEKVILGYSMWVDR